MKKFPNELSDLFSQKGQRLLGSSSPLLVPGRQFGHAEGVLDRRQAEAARRLLDQVLHPHLSLLEQTIPPETLYGMTHNYSEVLPKVLRCKTAYLERKKERAYAIAEELNLLTMLRSSSFHTLAQRLCGAPLKKRFGQQVICYEQGDYQGPHNDHHPQEPAAMNGYVDVHLSLATKHSNQQLIYARRGHLDQCISVARTGLLTVYRLPFWHMTTPLEGARARRWVLLGTFLFEQNSTKKH